MKLEFIVPVHGFGVRVKVHSYEQDRKIYTLVVLCKEEHITGEDLRTFASLCIFPCWKKFYGKTYNSKEDKNGDISILLPNCPSAIDVILGLIGGGLGVSAYLSQEWEELLNRELNRKLREKSLKNE